MLTLHGPGCLLSLPWLIQSGSKAPSVNRICLNRVYKSSTSRLFQEDLSPAARFLFPISHATWHAWRAGPVSKIKGPLEQGGNLILKCYSLFSNIPNLQPVYNDAFKCVQYSSIKSYSIINSDYFLSTGFWLLFYILINQLSTRVKIYKIPNSVLIHRIRLLTPWYNCIPLVACLLQLKRKEKSRHNVNKTRQQPPACSKNILK